MRKPDAARAAAVVFALATLALGGCSTPGPLHLYSVASVGNEIHDTVPGGNDTTGAVPTLLAKDHAITGFAYDPYTDHFFLRLNPGNRIQVIDRPARKVKREFVIEGAPADRGGDLTVRPRDGHLFLADASEPELIEASRLGKFIRRIRLEGRSSPAAAVAYDATSRQLVVLDADGRTFQRFDPSGRRIGPAARLERTVRPSLACDPDTGQLYALLEAPAAVVGVFDPQGRIVKTLRIEPGDQYVDVGPHSFLRLF